MARGPSFVLLETLFRIDFRPDEIDFYLFLSLDIVPKIFLQCSFASLLAQILLRKIFARDRCHMCMSLTYFKQA